MVNVEENNEDDSIGNAVKSAILTAMGLPESFLDEPQDISFTLALKANNEARRRLMMHNAIVNIIVSSKLNRNYVKTPKGYIKLLGIAELKRNVRKNIIFKRHVKIRYPNNPDIKRFLKTYKELKKKS